MPDTPLVARAEQALRDALAAAETPRTLERSGSTEALGTLLQPLSAADAERLGAAAGLLSRLAWERHRAARGWGTTGTAAPDGVSSVLNPRC